MKQNSTSSLTTRRHSTETWLIRQELLKKCFEKNPSASSSSTVEGGEDSHPEESSSVRKQYKPIIINDDYMSHIEKQQANPSSPSNTFDEDEVEGLEDYEEEIVKAGEEEEEESPAFVDLKRSPKLKESKILKSSGGLKPTATPAIAISGKKTNVKNDMRSSHETIRSKSYGGEIHLGAPAFSYEDVIGSPSKLKASPKDIYEQSYFSIIQEENPNGTQ